GCPDPSAPVARVSGLRAGGGRFASGRGGGGGRSYVVPAEKGWGSALYYGSHLHQPPSPRRSSASSSCTVGRLPLRSSGSFSTIFVSQPATPIGFFRSRNAYSTTILSFERHSRRPMVGLSSGWRRRSSTAER